LRRRDGTTEQDVTAFGVESALPKEVRVYLRTSMPGKNLLVRTELS
jgi:hypothetical protein